MTEPPRPPRKQTIPHPAPPPPPPPPKTVPPEDEAALEWAPTNRCIDVTD